VYKAPLQTRHWLSSDGTANPAAIVAAYTPAAAMALTLTGDAYLMVVRLKGACVHCSQQYVRGVETSQTLAELLQNS
jgi:hypothetical protein